MIPLHLCSCFYYVMGGTSNRARQLVCDLHKHFFACLILGVSLSVCGGFVCAQWDSCTPQSSSQSCPHSAHVGSNGTTSHALIYHCALHRSTGPGIHIGNLGSTWLGPHKMFLFCIERSFVGRLSHNLSTTWFWSKVKNLHFPWTLSLF